LMRSIFACLLLRLLPRSTLFSYTTLFRSKIIENPEIFGGYYTSELQVIRLLEVRQAISNPDNINDAVLCLVDRFYAAMNKEFERSEEHTSELQSRENIVCRLLLEKKKTE